MLPFAKIQPSWACLMAVALCPFAAQRALGQSGDPLAAVPAPGEPGATATQGGFDLSSPQLEEKVTIDFRGTPLGDVFRTLGEQAQINLVIGRSVNQAEAVTLRLNDVSYKTALQTLLHMNGLDAQTKDNIVRIDTVERVTSEISQRQRLQISEWNNQPSRVLIWQLNYASAETVATLVRQMIERKYTGLTNLSITTDARTNKLMIESMPEVLERAKSFIQILDKRKRQVLIEARIIEASRDLSKSLGVSWGARFGLDGRNGLSTGLVFPNSIGGSIGGAGSVGTPAPRLGAALDPTQVGSTALSIGSINNLINLDAVIRAYETESMANIIAAPRIVVEDQDTANINETTTQRRETITGSAVVTSTASFELSLTVTPRITNDGNIQMVIAVNRGTPGGSAAGNGVEAVTNRNARTNLSVADGETAVIGGLYQSSRRDGVGRIPILGDLPLIGWLFRTRDQAMLRTELMVLITPRLVKDKSEGVASSFGSNSDFNSMIPVSSSSAGNPATSNVPANGGLAPNNGNAAFSNNEFLNNELNNEFSNNEFSNNTGNANTNGNTGNNGSLNNTGSLNNNAASGNNGANGNNVGNF